jgi:hypothetical protein
VKKNKTIDYISLSIVNFCITILYNDNNNSNRLISKYGCLLLIATTAIKPQSFFFFQYRKHGHDFEINTKRTETVDMSDTSSTSTLIPRWLKEQCFRLRDEESNLLNLNLNIRRLDPITMEFLSEALNGNTRIESVNMTSSLSSLNREEHTDNDILTPLANAIRRHVSLKILHLSYNLLKDATSLGINLEMNQSSLKELYLDHNRLDNKTAVALARVIRQNDTLTVLQLNYNNIGDEGGKIIADALKDNTCLKTLGLAHNSLKSETASSLLQSLECNRNVTLLCLFLGDNPEFPKSLERTISYLVQANRAGRYLLRNDDGDERKSAIIGNDKRVSDSNSDNDEKNKKIQTKNGGGGDFKRRGLGLWPLVLQRSELDMLYFFLVQKPSLVRSSGYDEHQQNIVIRSPKRKRRTESL